MPSQPKVIASIKNHYNSYHLHRHSLNIDRPKSPRDDGGHSPKSASPSRSPTFFHHRRLHPSKSLPTFRFSQHGGGFPSSHQKGPPHVNESIVLSRNMLSLLTLGELPESGESGESDEESRNNHQQQSSNTTDSPANNTSTTSSANNNKATMKMKEHKDFDNIHIALAGAKNCGKSALAVRYLTKRFIGEYDSHKDDIWHRSMTVADREVRVSLKDTTGTSWLKTPAPLISWTTAIVVVYSITDRNSFALARHILEIIDKIKPLSSRCTLLIGNKCDLMHLRQVPKSDAKKLADDFGVHFLECSAAENYDDIFSSFTRLLVEAMIAQSAKKHSWDDQNADDVKQNENRLRKRSLSTGQAPSKDSNNNTSFLGGLREKKDSMIKIDERIPSPVEQRDTPAPQRKQSLRRKISGIGSKLVGSGQSNR